MGGVQTIIIITTTSAGYGGSEKSKTSNERRTHSPALLRRPTIYVVGIISDHAFLPRPEQVMTSEYLTPMKFRR